MARTGVAIMIGTRDAITIGTKGILGTAIVLGIRTMVGMAVGIKGLP
jgi:hypothetical protein